MVKCSELLYYTGVGSRETPDDICNIMTSLASRLEIMGFILRSGHAKQADQAFENGVKNYKHKEIYPPGHVSDAAWEIVEQVHPKPEYARRYRDTLGRNVYQVLGRNLGGPSKFLVGWTKGGKLIGGTATTIGVAMLYDVPVFNLFSNSMDDVLALAKTTVINNT